MVGWVKRFINNRNTAVENMTKALARSTCIKQAPYFVKVSMNKRMKIAGVEPPDRSFLVLPDTVEAKRSRGKCLIEMKPSRRNSQTKTAGRSLSKEIQQIWTEAGLAITPITEVLCMWKGVRFNGRELRKGSLVQFSSSRIVFNQPERSTTQNSLGYIREFYVVEDDLVVVKINSVTVVRVENTLLVAKVEKSRALISQLINADRILFKAKKLPHWDDDTLWVAVPVWCTLNA